VNRRRWLAAALALPALPLLGADIPRLAPPLEFISTRGERILIPKSYPGKVIVVEFLLTHCPACQDSARLLSGMQAQYAAKGLQVVGLAVDVAAGNLLLNFVEKFATGFPVGVYNPNLARDYMQIPPVVLATYPQFCLIDRKGIIREQHVNEDSFVANKEKNLRAMIEKYLAEPAAAAPKAAAKSAKKK
jgi:thiol-disulfide isomerase/thioredoxin